MRTFVSPGSIAQRGKVLGYPEPIVRAAVLNYITQDLITRLVDIKEELWLQQALYDVSNEEQRAEILRNVITGG